LPLVKAIPDQIKQVFLILLNNAADACLPGGGVITITTRHEGRRIAVAIKDTDIGITAVLPLEKWI
jgi:signal transduction histidine kinase